MKKNEAPTIEECLEIIKRKDEALKKIWDGVGQDPWPASVIASDALKLTPSSVRESIQVREELVARKDECLRKVQNFLLQMNHPQCAEQLSYALALTPTSLAETVRVREELVKWALTQAEAYTANSLVNLVHAAEAYRRAGK